VHKAFPRAQIYVRAFDRRSVLRMNGAPVQGIVREVLESAVVLARKALDGLGLSLEEIDKAESDYRARDRERLKLQHEAGDLHAARDRIFTQPERKA
jgi:glutathione-regulated potassium-efflux system protein KefB